MHKPDEVVKKIIVFFETEIKNEFSEFDNGEPLFEKAYFIESIG